MVLLLVEIVLSTGVFIRLDTEVERGGVSGIVHDRFVLDDEGPLERTGGRDSYAVMLGIAKGDIRHPEGYTPGLAYQTFDLPEMGGDSSFRMEVDTVSVRPECYAASVADTSGQTNLTVGSSMCAQDIPVSLTSRNASVEEQYHFVYEDIEGVEGCPADEPLVLAGVFQMKSTVDGGLEHVNSAAVVCKVPFYSGRRDVTRRRNAESSIHPTAEDDELVKRNLLEPVHYGLGYNGTFTTAVTGDDYLTDDLLPPFVLAAHLASSSPPKVDAFLDEEKLSDMMGALFTNFGPLAAHYNLREEDPYLSHGTFITVEQRLRVVPGITHAMTALFGVSLLLTAPMILYVPSRGITPRCPNSIAGTAVLLVNSKDIFERLRGADTSRLQSISERLRGSYYSVVEMDTAARNFVIKKRAPEEARAAPGSQPDSRKRTPNGYNPWVLRPLFRIISILITGAFAATLWGLVAASNNNQGLGSVSDPYHKSVLWTCLPAAALVGLGAYIKAIDFQTRLLAPFSALYNPNGFAVGMMTTYTDELAPVTAYKAAMSKSWAVMLAKGTAVLAVLMPILVCRLYTAEGVMTSTEVDVKQVEGFHGTADNVALVDAAAANVSFPWVHGDLVLPKAEVPGDMQGATVEAKLPAVRAELTCKPLTPSDGDITTVNCELLDPEQSVKCGDQTNDFFGHVATRCSSTSTGEGFSGSIHYMWGSCDGALVTKQAIISCDERVMEVEVEATLRGEALFITETKEDIETERETDIQLSTENMYNLQGEPDPWFDAFFDILSRTTSLGSDSTAESITSAIRIQHSLLRAQVLTAMRSPSSNALHKGTKTEKMTRLVQHPVPTYLLATVLTLAVTFSAASAIVAPANALPCSPGSVGAVAGMLAEWGMRVVPVGAEWMGDGELRRYFEGG